MSPILNDSRIFQEGFQKLDLKPLQEGTRKGLQTAKEGMLISWKKGTLDINGALLMFSYTYILAGPEERESEGRRFLGAFVEHYRRTAKVSEEDALALVDESLVNLVINGEAQRLACQMAELEETSSKQLVEIARLQGELEALQNAKLDSTIAHKVPMVPATELELLQKKLAAQAGEIAELRAVKPVPMIAKKSEAEMKNLDRQQEVKDALTEVGRALNDVTAEVGSLSIGNSMTGEDVGINERKKRIVLRALGSIGVDLESLRESV